MKDKIMGKFDTVKQLEDAYKKLEIEFTKRCQKIAQLEKEIEIEKNKDVDREQLISLLSDADFVNDYVLTHEGVTGAVVSAYLKSLKGRNRINLLGSNGTVALYVDKKPTTLKEAKALAEVLISRS